MPKKLLRLVSSAPKNHAPLAAQVTAPAPTPKERKPKSRVDELMAEMSLG